MLLFFSSCKDDNDNLVPIEYDPEVVPTLTTHNVSTLISDSGVTRYKIIADVWKVFDKAKEPYWYFPEGIYVERFTPDFNVEATIKADTAWYFNEKNLWRAKNNVFVENMQGDQFESDELFWDQKNGRVFSDNYIEIRRGNNTQIKGYGFESNQQFTDYKIFRAHDGKFPFVDRPIPSDTLLQTGSNTIEPDSFNK